MIRRFIKAAAASGLQRTGIAAWMGSRQIRARLPLVVGYHRVVEDFPSSARDYMPSMLISVATLERQLDWIGRRYRFVDPDTMEQQLDGRPGSGHPPAALVTFDDGYRDVYEHAFPLLRRKGIPALVFVVTDLVGSPELQFHDELYLLLARALTLWQAPERQLQAVLREAKAGPLPAWEITADPRRLMRTLFGTLTQGQLRGVISVLRRQTAIPETQRAELTSMDWDMLAEMQRAGIHIGSHTQSHALLTNEPAAKVETELRGSRRAITDRLGIAPSHFAYPDGRFNASVSQAVEDAGYRYGYTTCRHRDRKRPAMTIPRRLLWENACLGAFGRFSPAVLDCQVNGVFDFAAHCGINHAA